MNMDTQCGRADQDSDTYDANERIGRRDWGQHHTDEGSKSTQVAACKGTYSKQGQRVRRHHCRRFPALSARVLLRAPVSESALKLFGPKSVGTVRTHTDKSLQKMVMSKKRREITCARSEHGCAHAFGSGFCVGTVRGVGGSPLVGWVRSRRLSERPPGAEATRAARDAMLGRAGTRFR